MKLITTDVIGMVVMFNIQSWRLCYIVKHHLLLQSIALDIRKQNLLTVLSTVQLLISHSLVDLNSLT